MKITNFLMAAMAAMTIASCSKDAETIGPDNSLAPGDARITLDLGRSGATTYSTKIAENAILNGNAKLFNKTTGTLIPMTVTPIGADGKFAATVAAADLVGNPDATLYIYLNGTPTDATTGANDMVKHENATVTQTIDRELTTGSPSGLKADFKLKSGLINVATSDVNKAKRAISRVQAVNKTDETAKELSIKGFQISFDNIEVESGKIYAGINNALNSNVQGTTAKASYTLDHDGLSRIEEWTGNWETVAYMYPSSQVTVTIKASAAMGGGTRTATFTPKANKNYSINITPSSEDGTYDFTVAIDEWDQADVSEDMDADFSSNAKKLAVENVTFDAAFNDVELSADLIKLNALTSVNTASKVDLTFLADGVNILSEISKIEVDNSASTRAGGIKYLEVTGDVANRALMVKHAMNLSGADSPRIKVTITGKTDAGDVVGTFYICVGKVSKVYADAMAEATVEMGGNKWVMFNQHSDIAWCYEQALKIKQAGGFTLETIKGSPALFADKSIHIGTATTCPAGYKLPSLENYISLMDTHKIGGAVEAKWTPVVGDSKTFTNGRVLNFRWTNGANDSYYTLTDPASGKVMHVVGNMGYMTSTQLDGRLGDNIIVGNNYTLSVWKDGMTFGQATVLPSDIVGLRCVVDASYVDGGLL